MKMKKLLLFSILSSCLLIAGNVNASFIRMDKENETTNEKQESDSGVNKLKNISSINALLVGYGFYCRIDDTKIQIIHNAFQENIVNKLSEENKKIVLDNYEEKTKLAREKGPGFSSMTCENIYEEYSKILAIHKQNGNNLKINKK